MEAFYQLPMKTLDGICMYHCFVPTLQNTSVVSGIEEGSAINAERSLHLALILYTSFPIIRWSFECDPGCISESQGTF